MPSKSASEQRSVSLTLTLMASVSTCRRQQNPSTARFRDSSGLRLQP
jgi:hypothetical protein